MDEPSDGLNQAIVIAKPRSTKEMPKANLTLDLAGSPRRALIGAVGMGTLGSLVGYYAENKESTLFETAEVDIGSRRIYAIIGSAILGTVRTTLGASIERNIKRGVPIFQKHDVF